MDQKKIFELGIILLLAILIIMMSTKIFGHSATDVQVFITVISLGGIIFAYLIKINRELVEIKMDLKHSKNTADSRFDRIEEKLRDHDKKFSDIDKRFSDIDKRFDEIDKRFDNIDRGLYKLRNKKFD